jgi:hypothetical protein
MRSASSLLVALAALTTGPALAAKPAKNAAPAPVAAAPAEVAPAPADDGKPKPKTGISAILGTLDWGASHADVLAQVRARIDERYNKMLEEVRDPLEIDRALKRKAAEYAGIEKTYLRFSGARTGYESSLISQDFVTDSEESVLRVDDRDAQKYYFFKSDRLWKVVVAYNTSISKSVPFAEFVRQVQQKYDRPAAVEHETAPGGAKTIRTATWRDDLTELVTEDRTEFYGSFVMKFLDRQVGVTLEAERVEKRAQARTAPADDPFVSSSLAEITAGGDTYDEGDDSVVDRLTGVKHDVDLSRGRPDYDMPNRGPIASPTYPDEPAGKKGKKGKKGDRGGKGQAKPAEAAKPSEPFIIY